MESQIVPKVLMRKLIKSQLVKNYKNDDELIVITEKL